MWNQVSQSGPNQVVLRDVQSYMTGKYRCEVSADAPSFHTKIVSSWMHVVCEYLYDSKYRYSIIENADDQRGLTTFKIIIVDIFWM